MYETDGPIETTPPIDEGTVTPSDNSAQEPLEQQAGEQNSGNPAWQPFLDALPTSLHSQVVPILQEWDKGVQSRFEQIHNEYSAYKPFKEQGVDPETIDYALSIVNALNENPRQVYDSMAEYYKFNEQQAQQNDPAPATDYDFGEEAPVDPRVTQLEQGLQVMAQMLLEEQQAKAQAAEDAKLASEMADLKTKYGEYDEQYVLGRMLNGDSAETAVKAYQDLVNKVRSEANRPPAPKVMGSSGGAMPSQSVNPAKLSESERKQLITQMLAKAKEEG